MSEWSDSVVKDINDSVTCDDLKAIEAEIQKVLAQQMAMLENLMTQLESFLPVLSLPSIDPAEIVKWLGKLLTASIAPQITAFAKILSQIETFTEDVTSIAAAFENKVSEMESCVAGITVSSILPTSDLLAAAKTTLTTAQTDLASVNTSTTTETTS